MRTLAFVLAALAGCDRTVYLEDANNFSYVGTVDAPSLDVASGQDLEICWDGLTEDIQCHDVDPAADIGILTLARFLNLTEPEIEQQISEDTLSTTALSGFLDYPVPAGETCAQLEDFTLEGTEVDLAEEFYEGGGTYLLLAGAGTEPGQGTLALMFLNPKEASDVTAVTMGSACDTLDFSVDLSSLTPVALPASGDSWVVDWGGLTVNGLGNPFEISKLDRLMLGYYPDYGLTDLEEHFLDLEIDADALWYLDIGGTFSADLAQATGDDGAFAGFETSGTYVLALMCTTCQNPAPIFLTLVQVEG
jgi:hypothetical protein